MTWASGPKFLDRRGTNSPTIAYRLLRPKGEIKLAVLLTHGYGEHSGRYQEVVSRWNEQGILVAAYDLRGHGLSQGKRGHVDSFSEYVTDALDLVTVLENEPDWAGAAPPVLFGHSLGGLVSVHVALEAPDS